MYLLGSKKVFFQYSGELEVHSSHFWNLAYLIYLYFTYLAILISNIKISYELSGLLSSFEPSPQAVEVARRSL